MEFEAIKSLLEEVFPNTVVEEDTNARPQTLTIDAKQIEKVCDFLHSSEKTYFDFLSCLTGIDNGAEQNTMEVVYHLYSIPFDHHLALKVILDRANPVVGSVTRIWRTADWHEREAYDLLGIYFEGHPDLRRILLPEDWEGHPLRKDYEEQEMYHEVKVKY